MVSSSLIRVCANSEPPQVALSFSTNFADQLRAARRRLHWEVPVAIITEQCAVALAAVVALQTDRSHLNASVTLSLGHAELVAEAEILAPFGGILTRLQNPEQGAEFVIAQVLEADLEANVKFSRNGVIRVCCLELGLGSSFPSRKGCRG